MEQIPKNFILFNPFDYPEYTISRILEYGDKEAVTWMQKIFTDSQIKNVIKNDRKISSKSANFWALIYNIPLSEISSSDSMSHIPALFL